MLFRLALALFLGSDPGAFEAAYRAGLNALQQNQLPAAQAQLETASKLKPSDPRVWLALAQTYQKLHKTAQYQEAVRQAESFAGNDPVALHGLAFLYSEMGNYGKAAGLEARYAAMTPADSTATMRAVDLYVRASQAQPAVELATRALAKEDRADLRVLLGKAYALENNHAKAAEEMRRAIALNPYEQDYYIEAARESLLDRNPVGALQTVEAAKKIFTTSAQLQLVEGIAYYALEEYSQAVDMFLSAIRLDPASEQPYTFIARTLEHTPSRLPEILAAFKALADKSPANHLSAYFYGKALLFNGDAAEAETWLEKSVNLKGDDWESRLELAKALAQNGKLEPARDEFRKAIELNPKDPTAHYRLGRLYDRLGQPDAAKAEYARQKALIDEEESSPFRQQQDVPHQ